MLGKLTWVIGWKWLGGKRINNRKLNKRWQYPSKQNVKKWAKQRKEGLGETFDTILPTIPGRYCSYIRIMETPFELTQFPSRWCHWKSLVCSYSIRLKPSLRRNMDGKTCQCIWFLTQSSRTYDTVLGWWLGGDSWIPRSKTHVHLPSNICLWE